MLSDPSPLERLPEGITTKQLLFFDAVAVSMKMIDATYKELQDAIVEDYNSGGDPESDRGAVMVARAWSLVDTINRLRLLVAAMPGLKQSAAPVQSFLRAVAPAEELRHMLQHLNNQIDRIVASGGPVWGVLMWRQPNPEHSKQLFYGFFFPQHTGAVPLTAPSVVPVPVGTVTLPVDRIQLMAGGNTISLSDMHDAAAVFAQRLENAAAAAFTALPAEGAKGKNVKLVPEV